MIDKREAFFPGFEDEYNVSCDLCSYYKEYTDVFSWDELIERMKKEGWTIIYKDGDFEHRCPICSHKA